VREPLTAHSSPPARSAGHSPRTGAGKPVGFKHCSLYLVTPSRAARLNGAPGNLAGPAKVLRATERRCGRHDGNERVSRLVLDSGCSSLKEDTMPKRNHLVRPPDTHTGRSAHHGLALARLEEKR
jgi:hypothetical protein